MEFFIGGMAAASAGFFTNPLEVIKHHMELTKKTQFSMNRRPENFFNVGYEVVKENGLRSLQQGLSPALGAYLVSYGIKLGTYEFSQNNGLSKNSNGDVNVTKSVLTSSLGGLAGQYLSNPFYLVKTVHDVENAKNNNEKHNSYVDTTRKIFREQGLKGFFRGATASLPRAFIGTSQLTSFAVAKESLNKFEVFQENRLITTVIAGTIAGVVLSMATTPFELILSSMYKQAIGAKSKTEPYMNYMDCARKIYKTKGAKPFYSGMGPLYMKIGPHTMLCLLFWEQFKDLYAKQIDPDYMKYKTLHPVPVDGFYEKIGFLSREEHLYSNIFNEPVDEEYKISVYWN